MKKKFNPLLHLLGIRRSESEKLKKLLDLAVWRIAVVRNYHSVRFSQARTDVTQLLQQGKREHALLRVEHVIEEQNKLDAFALIANCCRLLGERTEEIQKSNSECPNELKEAISSLIFAAQRYGGLIRELQEIRCLFTSKYGKEFASSSVELKDDCKVQLKMIRSLSTQQASLEIKQVLLKQIERETIAHRINGIIFQATKKHVLNQEKLQGRPLEMWLQELKHVLNHGKLQGRHREMPLQELRQVLNQEKLQIRHTEMWLQDLKVLMNQHQA